jgi:transcriptional regulator with XRE-family HTH domain
LAPGAGDNSRMDMGVYGERLRARGRVLGLADAEVARRLGLAQSRYANYVNGNREPDLATFARICRALATTPNEVLEFGRHGEEAAEAEPERRRALAAIEAMDRPALRVAAVVLEAIAAKQDDLREG